MKAAGPQAGRAPTWGPGGPPTADIALPTRSGQLLDVINAGAGNSILNHRRLRSSAIAPSIRASIRIPLCRSGKLALYSRAGLNPGRRRFNAYLLNLPDEWNAAENKTMIPGNKQRPRQSCDGGITDRAAAADPTPP